MLFHLASSLLTLAAIPQDIDLAHGFHEVTGAYPSGTAIRAMSDGTLVTSNGSEINHYAEDGAFIAQIGQFASSGQTGAFVVDPTETFVIVGEPNGGEILRVPIDGSGQTLLATVVDNHDATFESPSKVIISAQPCDAGPACGVSVFRMDVNSGAIEGILATDGQAGPVSMDQSGGLIYGTRSQAPIALGTSDLLSLSAAELANAPSPVFQSHDDLVVIEIESHPPVDHWTVDDTLVGFTGESYYRWDGPDHYGSPGNGVMTYEFEVQTATNYKMKIHNRHDNPQPDLDNDCWVRVDGGQWFKCFSNEGSSTVGVWNWESVIEEDDGDKYSANYDLSVGRHVLEISARSEGYMADRVVFYPTTVFHALDTSNPESIHASYNTTHTTPFATGLTGADELVLEPETGQLFLAEYVENLGINRIRRITPDGAVNSFVNGIDFQRIRDLSFRAQAGPGLFYPFQPPGYGQLNFTRKETGVVNERHIISTNRPETRVAGPGASTGTGDVNLTVEGGPPLGIAVLVWQPTPTLSPTEIVVALGGSPPLFTSMLPTVATVIPSPLFLDANGDTAITFFHSGVVDAIGVQSVLITSTGEIIGTSNTTLL